LEKDKEEMMGMKDKIFSIPIKLLCFEYRDNVLLWFYIMSVGNKRLCSTFTSGHSNRKIRSRGSYIYNRILSVKRSIEVRGQMTPISVIKVGDELHPVDGMKRLVALLLMGEENVLIKFVNWIEDYSMRSSYFSNVHFIYKKRFLKWRRRCYESGTIIKKNPTAATLQKFLHEIPELQPDRAKRTKTSRGSV
jgi:hypothetical protein